MEHRADDRAHRTLCRLLAVATASAAVALPSPGFATAIYEASATVALTAPSVRTNLFGFGGPTFFFRGETAVAPPAFFDEPIAEHANFVTVIPDPEPDEGSSWQLYLDQNVVPPLPSCQNGLADAPCPALDDMDARIRLGQESYLRGAGGAGPGGPAFSSSIVQQMLTYRLGNFSGSGVGDPPVAAQFFNAVFDLDYVFDLTADVDDPATEEANAAAGILVRSRGEGEATYSTLLDILVPWEGLGTLTSSGTTNFSVLLPSNSITELVVEYFVRGAARTDPWPEIPPPNRPPPLVIPEPAPIAYLGVGLFILWLRRRRWG